MKSSKEGGGWGVCGKLSVLVPSRKFLGHALCLAAVRLPQAAGAPSAAARPALPGKAGLLYPH